MSSDEANYYRARAEAERALAQSSTNPAVAGIHEEMAALYERLIALDKQPRGNVVTPFDRSQLA